MTVCSSLRSPKMRTTALSVACTLFTYLCMACQLDQLIIGKGGRRRAWRRRRKCVDFSHDDSRCCECASQVANKSEGHHWPPMARRTQVSQRRGGGVVKRRNTQPNNAIINAQQLEICKIIRLHLNRRCATSENRARARSSPPRSCWSLQGCGHAAVPHAVLGQALGPQMQPEWRMHPVVGCCLPKRWAE